MADSTVAAKSGFARERPGLRSEEAHAVLGRSDVTLLVVLGSCFAMLSCSLYSLVLSAGSVDYDLRESYFILAAEGVLFSALLLIKYERSGIYLFEPFTVVTATMVLVYFAAPLFRFASGSTDRYGVEVSPYCLEGTILVMVGYFSFFLLYEFGGVSRRASARSKAKKRSVFFRGVCGEDARRLVVLAWCIWIVGYLLTIAYYSGTGLGIVYILTGGLVGGGFETIESSTSFLSYLKYTLLAAWMMIYVYGGSRAFKVISYCLTFSSMMLSGGRVGLFAVLLAPLVFSYARNKRTPRFSYTVLLIIALIFLFAIVQVARAGIQSGAGFSLEGYSLEEIFEPFYSEIDDFKSYYALFAVIPEKHDFLFGSQMILYSLILFIPRAIWPGKPEPEIYDIIELSLGSQAMANGNAYPSIGEYYVEFGVIGVIVCMAVLGYACRRLKNCYLHSEGRSLAVMAYALVWPALLSLVIRGYFPQNFAMLVFMLAPVFIFWLVLRAQVAKRASRVNGAEPSNWGSQ